MARQVLTPIGTDFPPAFDSTLSGSQIVADDLAGLTPESDGFDDLLTTALANIDSEPSAIADLDTSLSLMDFVTGAFEGANITPMLADFANVTSAGDSLEADAAGFLSGAPVTSSTPAPPVSQGPPTLGGGGGDGGGGGGGGPDLCLTDTGEPAPVGSPLCSTF